MKVIKKDYTDKKNEDIKLKEHLIIQKKKIYEIKKKIKKFLSYIPNLPHNTVPIGRTFSNNIILQVWGK
ncbi:hypothetical protein LDP14_02055, partial [Buchnera aphidicola (Stegophylla sp.)]|nr:hypothetical protein [Buchnera aphidicola (Stegophylla sp.)]